MSDGDEDDHAGTLADLYQRTAAAGTGAMLGLGIGGPAGVIAGASFGVPLEPLAAKVWYELPGDGKATRSLLRRKP
jgi:hypothetical protein